MALSLCGPAVPSTAACPQVLEQNYRLKLLYSPDYRNMDPDTAMTVRPHMTHLALSVTH